MMRAIFQRRRMIWLIVLPATLMLILIWQFRRPVEIAPYAAERVLRTSTVKGVQYKLADDGNVFRVIPGRGAWTWVDRVFEPDQVAREYLKQGSDVYYVDPGTSKRYKLLKHFEEGFEDIPDGVDGLRKLIGEERKWTEFTLQSPKTPNVSDYVSLRNRIMKENAGFLDASVNPSSLKFHRGKQSLRCECPPKSSSMICSKASIGSSFFYFEQGEELWFRAYFLIDGKTKPFTLADIEGRHVKQSPGIRLMLFDEGYLGVELKAIDKPKYQQPTSHRILFPTDKWVQVTWSVLLHPDDGVVRVWQDDQLVIDATGPTLPFATMVLNSLEVGISAHSFGNEKSVLYVDDLVFSNQPLKTVRK